MNDFVKSGEFIASLRKEKGMTQQELGSYVGVGDKTVSKWERGINVPDVIMIKKIAVIFEVDVEEILNGERNAKLSPKFIKMYENKTFRYSLFASLGIILILLFTFFIYFCNNFDKFKVYRFKSEASTYELTGNIYQVSNKYKMVIDDFIVSNTDKYDKLKIDLYKISIYLGDDIVYYYLEEKNKNENVNISYERIIDIINRSDLIIQTPKSSHISDGYIELVIVVGEKTYTEKYEFKNMLQERNNAFFYDHEVENNK